MNRLISTNPPIKTREIIFFFAINTKILEIKVCWRKKKICLLLIGGFVEVGRLYMPRMGLKVKE